MNKRHKCIALNNERWLKKLASQVGKIDLELTRVCQFYAQAYFTPKAAAQVVIKLKRSRCQALARHIRHLSLPTPAHGTYFRVKWPMFVYASVDRDLLSPRSKAWLAAYKEYLHAADPKPFTRF